MRKVHSNFIRNLTIILTVVTGILTSSCQVEKNDHVLAKIEDLEVTEAHFLSAFKRYYYRSGKALKPSFEVKNSILNSEFNTLILSTHARDIGIATDEYSRRQEKMIYRRIITEEFMNSYLSRNAMVTEEDIRDAFNRHSTQLRVSHLYAPNREMARALYDQLQSGTEFEKLAQEVFSNSELAETGGDLGVINIDEMDPAFENIAYSLQPGEYSKPVQTAQGFSIIKVTQKVKKPLITEYEFAEMKGQMTYFADKMKKELAKRAHMYAFMENAVIDEASLSEVFSKVNNSYSLFIGLDKEFFSSFNSDKIILSYKDVKISIADLMQEVYLTPVGNLNRIKDLDGFRNLIIGIGYRSYLIEEGEMSGINKNPDFQASLDQSVHTYLKKRVLEKLKSEIVISDEELIDHYLANTDQYVKPLEMNMQRIVFRDEETAMMVHQKLVNGADFEEMVDLYTVSNEERLTKGELGYKYIGDFGFLSPKLSALLSGEISEPLFYQSGEFHIYKVLGRKESILLRYGQAKAMVEQTLIKQKLDERVQRVLEDVKQQHNAVVNQQKLRELTIQI